MEVRCVFKFGFNMAIKFAPLKGQLLLCDFKGYIAPEIVKRRPVIVITPPNSHGFNTELCTIVPLSTTEPNTKRPYHYLLHDLPKMPHFQKTNAWVKCDLIYTVSYERLFLPLISKETTGKRNYLNYCIDNNDFSSIIQCVLYGLGLNPKINYL